MARSTVAVRFTGDVADLKRSLNDVDGRMGKLSSGLATFGKTAAIGLGAAAVGAVAMGKSFVDAAYESQKVTKQTGAVLKSMGLEARASAEDIAKLSTQLSLKTGIDDELIQSGSNVLLTFGEVAKQVGSNTKIFDRANAAALDMSVALGTDMNSAAMQVGKALNDPIRGLTTLRRSGIQFTKQQEEQIKAMVEAGDVAGAQTVMLAELEKQFGGSAAAQATASDKLKVAWGNVQEELGAKLIPVLEKVATWLAAHLPAAMAKVQGFIEQWWPRVVAGFQAVVGFVQTHWPAIQDVITAVMTTVEQVISAVVSVIQTVWDNFGNNILSFVQRVWPAVRQVIEAVMNIIRGVITTVTALIQGDWSRVWEGIKQTIFGVWSAIQGIVKAALEAMRLSLGVALEAIGSVFRGAWDGIVNWFSSLPGRVGRVAGSIWNALKEGLDAAIRWIARKLDSLLGPLDEIAGKVGGVVGKLGGAIGSVGGALGKLPGLASGGIVRARPGGTIVRLGEGGEDELVTPFSRIGTSGGGTVINLNVAVDRTMDPGQVGKALVEAISAYERRAGTGWRR